jgi:type II secretory pathway component PulF
MDMEQLSSWWKNLHRPQLEQQQLIEFLQALTDLLETGLDLSTALLLVADMLPGKALKVSCERQIQCVMNGGEWHEALACDAIAWPASTLAWVRIAMSTGDMALCLRTHIAELKTSRNFRQVLLSKLSYPLFVLVSSIALAYFMHTQLTTDTLVTEHASPAFSLTNSLLVAGLLFTLFLALCALYSKFKHLSPLRTRIWWRCCCALGVMLQCGQSLQQALDVLLWDLKHLWIKAPEIGESLYHLNQLIVEGEPLRTALVLSGWPPLVVRAATIAQASGDLVTLFNQSARILDIKAKAMQQKLISWIPILAMVCAAATLCGLYISQIKPLYDNLVSQEMK